MLVLYSIGFDYIKSHLKEQFVVKEGDTSHSSEEEEDFFFCNQAVQFQENTKTAGNLPGMPRWYNEGTEVFPGSMPPVIEALTPHYQPPLPARDCSALQGWFLHQKGHVLIPKLWKSASFEAKQRFLVVLDHANTFTLILMCTYITHHTHWC